MTKGSKKRHFGSLGVAGDEDHSGNGPAKKRKFSSVGASAGSTGTPKHATATPAKASNGKAVISKTPSGKQTPKTLATPSNVKGGKQHGQASAKSKAKRHSKLFKKQSEQDQRASAVTAGATDSHDVAASQSSTGDGAPKVPEHASSTLDADQARERPRKRKRKDRLSRVEVAAVDDAPSNTSQSRDVAASEAAKEAKIVQDVPPPPSMAPVAKSPQAGASLYHYAPVTTAQSTSEASGTTHEQKLEPPSGLSKTALKRWKRRRRSSLAHHQSSEAGGSSPTLSRMDSRQSAFTTPGVLRQPAAVSSTADPGFGVKLPDPPTGLNEHQRKLWVDRVRRVTLEILTPSKASQPEGEAAAYVIQSEVSQNNNKNLSSEPLSSSQHPASHLAKVRDPELWRQATTTTLIAAPEKRWVQTHTESATTSIGRTTPQKTTTSRRQALFASSGRKAPFAHSEPATSAANVEDQEPSIEAPPKHDQPEEAKEDSSESDAEESDSDEADEEQETPDVEDLAQDKTEVSQITQVQETAQALDQDAGISSSESENEESDEASEADNALPTNGAPEHASPSHEDEASSRERIPAVNGHQLAENRDPSSSPVAFDDNHEDDRSHDENDAGDKGLEPHAHQTKDEEMFPSSAPVLNRPRTSQSTVPTAGDDSDGLDSDVTRDRQSPPRIKFSAKSFKLGNAANALGYSVKPAARSVTSPKAKQVDARDAFRRFSSFVEGSDSEESDESDSDDESEKSAHDKNRQPVVAKVVSQKPLSSQVIPDSQSGNGLQVEKAVTSSATDSKVRDFAHLPLVPDSQPLVPVKHDKMQRERQVENKHVEHDEDSNDDDVEEDDDEAEALDEDEKLPKQPKSNSLTRAAAPTTADSHQEIDASSNSDSDEECASDDEGEDDEEETDESSDGDDDDDNEDDVGGAPAPQDKGLTANSMPHINGHRDMDQAQTSRTPVLEHRQGQQRKAGSAETHGTGIGDDAAESSDDSVSPQEAPDDEESDGETRGSIRAKTTADIDMADGNDAAIDGPAHKQDAADRSDLQPAATWSFEALAENGGAVETHIVAADTSDNNPQVTEPVDKPGDHTAVQDEEADVIDADLVAQDAGDVVELPADVDTSDDKKISNVGEDGCAASGEEDDEEQEKSEEEQQAPATTEAEEDLPEDDGEQHPAVHLEQSIYAAASQPEWRKITDERVKAQLLGELAASQSEDAGEVDEAIVHANKRGRKRATGDVTNVDDEIEDYVASSMAQDEAADVSPIDSKGPIGFTAINKQADQTSKLQPESTGKLKRPSAFLEHRSGGSGSGRALTRVSSSQRVDSSPTVAKKTSFTFGENDDEELDRSISEIQKDVFASTRALPFSIYQSDKPDDRLAGGLQEDLAVDSSHRGLKSRRQLARVVIPPVQPEDYNNILVYSADVPEPDDAPASESEKSAQIANHRLPSQAAEASSQQPVPADDAEQSRSIKAIAGKPEVLPNLAPRDPNDPEENAVKCYVCSKDGRRCLKPVAGEADPRCRRCLNRKANCVSYEEGLRRAQMRKEKLKQPNSGKRFEEGSKEKPRKNVPEQFFEEPKEQLEEQSEEAPQEQPKAKPKKSPKEKSKEKSKEQPKEQLKENLEENITLTTTDSDSAEVEYTQTDDADRCYGCASRNCHCYRPPLGHEDPRCKGCVSRKRPCRTYQEGLEISNQRQAAKQQKELAALHFDDVDASIVNADTKAAAAAAREAAAKAMPPPANPRKRKTTGMTSRHFSPAKRSKHDQSVGHDRASVDLDTSTVVSEDVSAAAREEEATEHIILPKKTPKPRKKSKSTGTKSPHFLPLHLLDRVDMPTPSEGRLPAGVSRAAVPPIASARFGIIQEKLWNEPFWLIIAVTFLNKTAGRAAAPTFWKLKEQYRTPEALAEADQDELHDMIQHLGLQNQRARRLLAISKAWVEEPPIAGKRHKTMNYPAHGDHAEFKGHPKGTPIEGDVENCKGALEIGHIPGCGPYAWDSWRIFCRDVLRGVAEDYNGKGAADESFEPEWKRVLPLDKELVATLRWMWLREGWIWDHKTGKKRKATDEEMERAEKGEMEVADVQEGKFAAQAAGAEKIYEPTIANGQDDEEGEEGSESDSADEADEADGVAVSEADSSDTDVPAKPKGKAGRKGGSSEQ